MKDIPDWAFERAVNLTIDEGDKLRCDASGKEIQPAVIAFARYIAEKEPAPADAALRDQIALAVLPDVIRSRETCESWSWSMDEIASDAYSMADAMLRAREADHG